MRIESVTRGYRHAGGSVGFRLHPATLEIASGTWTAISGPSGSGKTTLLHLLAGLDRPDEGRVWILGRELSGYSEAALSDLRREHLGFVHQGFHFIEHLRVWQNVAARLVPAGLPGAARRARAVAALGELGLESIADRLPRELSGGERQRVALARALCGRPSVLIADEPTSSVDARTGTAIVEHLGRLRVRGTTIVTATHDPALLAAADVRHVLEGGRIVG
jgi:putative ABC transport system ATP-binding protein